MLLQASKPVTWLMQLRSRFKCSARLGLGLGFGLGLELGLGPKRGKFTRGDMS